MSTKAGPPPRPHSTLSPVERARQGRRRTSSRTDERATQETKDAGTQTDDQAGHSEQQGEGQTTEQDEGRTTQTTEPPKTEEAKQQGEASIEEAGDNAEGSSPEEMEGARLARAVWHRLKKERRWTRDVEGVRDALMARCNKLGMSKLDAQTWTYTELERLYPPLNDGKPPVSGATLSPPEQGVRPDDGAIRGLRDIPEAWGDLPSQVSLAVEVGWVQANRLLVVEDGTPVVVRLDRAGEPAPSRSALGWLETAIRSYAKFVDVAARTAAGSVDAEDDDRRERMALAEIDDILSQMDTP